MLGYCDPEVDAAIQAQLKKGISFSLATELETELSERLVDLIPCAEMVRFGKNGSDATTGCIRIARAATGRDRIALCGYHGWHDWYIGSTVRDKGVPAAVSELSHCVPYDDVEAVDRLFSEHPGEFAAFIMEPMTVTKPSPGYFEDLISVVHRHGALLIFDEIVTGFRYAAGGAQEYFGVVPDLAAFGKGMGNGMPISAIVGKERYMTEMEEVFFSGTFGGECLSIAAAIAVIDKMRREPVMETIRSRGREMAQGARRQIEAAGVQDAVRLRGLPALTIVEFVDQPGARKEAIRTLFLEQMLLNGVLIGRSHNVCYAHDTTDVHHVVEAYGRVMTIIAEELSTGRLEQRLRVPVVEPVFSVR